MLVLEGLVVFIEPFNFSFFGISGWGIDLDYCDIKWVALDMNRDYSVFFKIAHKYCISDSFVDYAVSKNKTRQERRAHPSSPVPSPEGSTLGDITQDRPISSVSGDGEETASCCPERPPVGWGVRDLLVSVGLADKTKHKKQ